MAIGFSLHGRTRAYRAGPFRIMRRIAALVVAGSLIAVDCRRSSAALASSSQGLLLTKACS